MSGLPPHHGAHSAPGGFRPPPGAGLAPPPPPSLIRDTSVPGLLAAFPPAPGILSRPQSTSSTDSAGPPPPPVALPLPPGPGRAGTLPAQLLQQAPSPMNIPGDTTVYPTPPQSVPPMNRMAQLPQYPQGAPTPGFQKTTAYVPSETSESPPPPPPSNLNHNGPSTRFNTLSAGPQRDQSSRLQGTPPPPLTGIPAPLSTGPPPPPKGFGLGGSPGMSCPLPPSAAAIAAINASAATTVVSSTSSPPPDPQLLAHLLETGKRLGIKWIDQERGGAKNITDEDRANWRAFRAKVVAEMLSTERSYVKSLETMFRVYKEPFEQGQTKTGLSVKKIKILFTIPQEILAVAKKFLVALGLYCMNWARDEVIAPAFVRWAPEFHTPYSEYSLHHQKDIMALLDKLNSRSVWTTFQTQQMITYGCLSLASYLITPIQRLPRYKLLLESLLSRTETTHPEACSLLYALEQISLAATTVNSAMNDALTLEYFTQVSRMFKCPEPSHPWRKLLHEIPCVISRVWGPLAPPKTAGKKPKREKKHRHVGQDATIYIFTDCIWIGVINKDRKKKLDESLRKDSTHPFPIYAEEFNFKLSLTYLASHSLSTSSLPEPIKFNDYSYHHSIILTSPIGAVCLNLPNPDMLEHTTQAVADALQDFQALIRSQSLDPQPFVESPPHGKPADVLTCDACLLGLSQHQKLEMGGDNYFVLLQHLICNQCQNIVCVNCLEELPVLPAAAPAAPLPTSRSGSLFGLRPSPSGNWGDFPSPRADTPNGTGRCKVFELLGSAVVSSCPSTNPAHTASGWGACLATGRFCKTCHGPPDDEHSRSRTVLAEGSVDCDSKCDVLTPTPSESLNQNKLSKILMMNSEPGTPLSKRF